jgi:hypothetical protein
VWQLVVPSGFLHVTEYSVKGDAIVRKKGLNIYIIFSNKKKNIKIYLPI